MKRLGFLFVVVSLAVSLLTPSASLGDEASPITPILDPYPDDDYECQTTLTLVSVKVIYDVDGTVDRGPFIPPLPRRDTTQDLWRISQVDSETNSSRTPDVLLKIDEGTEVILERQVGQRIWHKGAYPTGGQRAWIDVMVVEQNMSYRPIRNSNYEIVLGIGLACPSSASVPVDVVHGPRSFDEGFAVRVTYRWDVIRVPRSGTKIVVGQETSPGTGK